MFYLYIIATLSIITVSIILLNTGVVDAQVLNEAQQQLDGVQQTVDTVGQQAQSVKEKGLFQTIWDNTVGVFFAQIAAVWQQIIGIFGSIFGSKA